MFVWRSNLLGSSGKGHEYFLKHLLGTTHGVQGKDLGETARKKPKEVAWHDDAPQGKLDLLVTLDFRMWTTCLYSDIVLPTATWYEKNDLNTSRHASLHPPAVRRGRSGCGSASSDWDIYKGIAKKFSRGRAGSAGRRKGARAHADHARHAGRDRAGHSTSRNGRRAKCDPIPGKTMPSVTVVERDYPNVYKRFTALGPLMAKLGNGGKGMAWNTEHEVELLRRAQWRRHRGRARPRACRRSKPISTPPR